LRERCTFNHVLVLKIGDFLKQDQKLTLLIFLLFFSFPYSYYILNIDLFFEWSKNSKQA